MNCRLIQVGLALVALVAVPVAQSYAATHDVIVENFSFFPADLTVQAGDTVRWVWHSGNHTTTSGDVGSCTPDGLWNAPVNMSNPSYSRTFDDAGVFPYYCIPHCGGGMSGTITVEEDFSGIDDDLPIAGQGSVSVLSASPNPFYPSTVLSFELARSDNVRLDVYDASGRKIRTLADGRFESGRHQVVWDGRTDTGARAPAGVYYATRLLTMTSNSLILALVR